MRDGFKMLGSNRKASPNFIERRLTKILRPVDLSEVENPHLYYNHKDEVHMKLKLWKQKRKVTIDYIRFRPSKVYYLMHQLKNS